MGPEITLAVKPSNRLEFLMTITRNELTRGRDGVPLEELFAEVIRLFPEGYVPNTSSKETLQKKLQEFDQYRRSVSCVIHLDFKPQSRINQPVVNSAVVDSLLRETQADRDRQIHLVEKLNQDLKKLKASAAAMEKKIRNLTESLNKASIACSQLEIEKKKLESERTSLQNQYNAAWKESGVLAEEIRRLKSQIEAMQVSAQSKNHSQSGSANLDIPVI